MRTYGRGVHVLGIFFKEPGWSLHPISVVCTHNLPVRLHLNVSGGHTMLGPHRGGVLTPIPSQSRAYLWSFIAVKSLTNGFVEVLLFLSLTATSPIRSNVVTFKKIVIKVNLLYRFRSFHRK